MHVIILAAGKGTRMNLEVPKVLAPLQGRPMIAYVLDAVLDAQIDPHPIVVVGYQAEAVQAALSQYPAQFVFQREQKGTGHAVAVCEAIVDQTQPVMVLCGDHPLVSAATVGELADEHDSAGAAITMATYTVPDFNVYDGAFGSFGRIIRDQAGRVSAIREYKDESEAERGIHEVNPAYYVFSGPWLWKNIKRLGTNNAQSEYYLTDLVAMAIADGERVKTVAGTDLREAVGINTQEQLSLVSSKLL